MFLSFNDYIVMLEEINNNFIVRIYLFFFMNFYIINQRLLVLYFGGNQIEKLFYRKFKVYMFSEEALFLLTRKIVLIEDISFILSVEGRSKYSNINHVIQSKNYQLHFLFMVNDTCR